MAVLLDLVVGSWVAEEIVRVLVLVLAQAHAPAADSLEATRDPVRLTDQEPVADQRKDS